MQNVTDEVSNPFGMRPPCPFECEGGHRAVLGYGDANADFHVIGDHPGVHGGGRTGVPFTDVESGERLLDVLSRTGFVRGRDERLDVDNCFLSYRYGCCLPVEETPTPRDYGDYELFFDAELRAIAADVLLPVGEPTTEHVLSEYTAQAHRLELDMRALHGRHVRGRGFLVVPIRDPANWEADDEETIVDSIEALLSSDYHQMVDLGRFVPGGDPYFVR